MTGYLLLELSSDWVIGSLGSPPSDFEYVGDRSVSAQELASAVNRFFDTRDASAKLLIGLHATSVVSATFTPAASVNRSDRRAMLYELEQSLPFDAEDATADFAGSERNTVGVAVRTDKLLRLVEDVEAGGAQVLSIFPAALGAAQEFGELNECVAWRSGGAVEVIACDRGHLRSWSHLPDTPATVTRTVELEDLGSIKLVEDPEIPGSDFAVEINATSTESASLLDHVSKFAAKVAAGDVTPWIELRRGELANGDPNRQFRKPLNWLAATVAVLLVAFSMACWYRAGVYETQAAGFADQQRSLFKQVFPGIRTNAPMSRLRSEHARFMSSRQTNTDVELPVSAIEPTVRALSAPANDLRFKLTEFRMENGNLDLAAEVRSYSDATKLAQALEASGFDVSPEGQEQLAVGRISTKLRGVSRREQDGQSSAEKGGE